MDCSKRRCGVVAVYFFKKICTHVFVSVVKSYFSLTIFLALLCKSSFTPLHFIPSNGSMKDKRWDRDSRWNLTLLELSKTSKTCFWTPIFFKMGFFIVQVCDALFVNLYNSRLKPGLLFCKDVPFFCFSKIIRILLPEGDSGRIEVKSEILDGMLAQVPSEFGSRVLYCETAPLFSSYLEDRT